MRTVIERIGDYVADLKYEDLPGEVVDYTRRILLDTLACAYGGLENDPSRMVLNTVRDLEGGAQATLFGRGIKGNAQLAAGAKGISIRSQDYNDVYIGPGWSGHPSDCIATLFALGEWKKSTGRDLLLAIVAG